MGDKGGFSSDCVNQTLSQSNESSYYHGAKSVYQILILESMHGTTSGGDGSRRTLLNSSTGSFIVFICGLACFGGGKGMSDSRNCRPKSWPLSGLVIAASCKRWID